jgi:UDP-N-acetylglucosamine 2-epimerase (non-hydrolysing)
MKVLHVVGTRPNFMKVAPVIAALQELDGVEQRLVHTGQHYDSRMSDVFFEDLSLPYPDHFLGVGSGTHAEQTARVMLALEPVLTDEAPDVTIVPGDVNSTVAAAMTAVKLRLPVAHLEAGLRSWDRSMPEEHNRVVTDHVADLLLTPSRDANANLVAETIPEDRIAFVGNTMIDSLRRYERQAREKDVARRDYGVEGHLLITLHRPGLVDHPDRFLPVMNLLDAVATERPVLFPIHPRSRTMLDAEGWRPRHLRLLEPHGYLRFLSLLTSASAVLTDSGGIQEEATVLGVPCFTLRANTERPITVTEGTNRVLGVGDPALEAFAEAMASPLEARPGIPEKWDGRAGERVARVLVDRFGSGRSRGLDAYRVTPTG